ncbi:MAG: polynucleotide kinase-phosphatase [Sulfobacillus benefaciens]|uniref:Polynucleotide kinase-phosphatase n=1 Tax=Sulfobacillus benefaciens TaxID=453960 RepID=A0A2T2XHE5_9FIRM|nr:MAG: polynucleotide kinase-phosphatase [Sulfobacillus benefaciens]
MLAKIPELSLILLIGASGSGKSSFAQKHFLPTEILSSDACRAMVSDDETNQAATGDAFDVLHYIAGKRLARGRLTVIDATNVQSESRRSLIALARQHHVLVTAIVLNLPEQICINRNSGRTDRQFSRHVIQRQIRQLKSSLSKLRREGMHQVIVLSSEDEIEAFQWERQPLWNNKSEDHGPFDIIGDVHGCFDELHALVEKLGYHILQDPKGAYQVRHPESRKLVFLGDLVDRGPKIADVLRFVMDAVDSGTALCVPGNHESKLLRKLKGLPVTVSHGLQETLDQLDRENDAFRERTKKFLDGLVSHYVLDSGRLIVAHAGLPETMHGRGSAKVREFALYGETTGETDEFGLPIRYNWASDYRGNAMVVYGHTPVPQPEWLNRTINIDTGCVFGGRLTALRYPENQLVDEAARRVYTDPIRPLNHPAPGLSAQQVQDDVLDIADIAGKRRVQTHLMGTVTVPEENGAAALEVLSRFAADPKWLIYLPPTMSPAETSQEFDTLEHPMEAFLYFQRQNISDVICEQKHMGSRAVIIVCRDDSVAKHRFGVQENSLGIIYTRTGRHFFENPEMELALLNRVRMASETAGLFDHLQTDWLLLDTEIMPWSLKAQDLIQRQYAAVGRAAHIGLAAAVDALTHTARRGLDTADLTSLMTSQQARAEQFIRAYRRYVWPVRSLDDVKIAPFHLLASEGKVHMDQDHEWHLEKLQSLTAADSALITPTPTIRVLLDDSQSIEAGVVWWEQITAAGFEGMVVKPLPFVARNDDGKLVQPAIKVRGREYLRIIYGPDYNAKENLDRLRHRGLAAKRAAALREFALGLEGLQRFVAGEPLRRVHECVHAVLALESQPVDPRL